MPDQVWHDSRSTFYGTAKIIRIDQTGKRDENQRPGHER
jgi:hypothetical protein